MDPRVPTGMKAGVVTSPWGVVNTPVRARRAPSSPGVVPVTRKPKGPCELWIVSVTCRGQPLESGAGVVVAQDPAALPSLAGEVAQRLLAEADSVTAAAALDGQGPAPIGRPGRGRVVTMAEPLRTSYPIAARRSSKGSTRSAVGACDVHLENQRPARSTRAGAMRRGDRSAEPEGATDARVEVARARAGRSIPGGGSRPGRRSPARPRRASRTDGSARPWGRRLPVRAPRPRRRRRSSRCGGRRKRGSAPLRGCLRAGGRGRAWPAPLRRVADARAAGPPELAPS